MVKVSMTALGRAERVNRRDLGTPAVSIKSKAYRADRRRDPTPIYN
jgi:hypothetical protein